MYFASMTEVNETFSDLFKDAHGFRPRFDTSLWTLEDFNEEAERLQATIEENFIEEKERKAQATQDFMALVEKCKTHGAKDDAEAIRWLLQADEVDNLYDLEDWMWKHDIDYTPYGTYVKAIVTSNLMGVISC